jgi:hypothetical protein
MTFELSGWILYMMWGVIGVIGLDMVAGIYRSIITNSFSFSRLPGFLGGILGYVFPMMLLANMMSWDPTGWLILIAYYIGGVGVIVKYLMDIKGKLGK